MSRKQLSLFEKERTEHGGDVLQGRRKLARPFSPKCSIHVVMRASRARGKLSMRHRRNRANVEKLVYKWAAAKQIKIYRFANVGNHLHFLLRAPNHLAFKQFLKTFAGLAARAVTGAMKGARQGRFWDKTAYSNLVPGGAFKALCAYLGKNELEAVGFRGARLRFREDGKAVIVIGEPRPDDSPEVERRIRRRCDPRPGPRSQTRPRP